MSTPYDAEWLEYDDGDRLVSEGSKMEGSGNTGENRPGAASDVTAESPPPEQAVPGEEGALDQVSGTPEDPPTHRPDTPAPTDPADPAEPAAPENAG